MSFDTCLLNALDASEKQIIIRMRGLYINISDDDQVHDALHVLKIPHQIIEFPSQLKNKGLLVYSPDEWQQEPVYRDDRESLFIAAYGWFIYQDEKNNLKRFAADFKKDKTGVLDRIDGGIYLIYIEHHGRVYLINDLLSLSHHFYDTSADTFKIAPSPCFFDQKEESGFFRDVLYHQGQLHPI